MTGISPASLQPEPWLKPPPCLPQFLPLSCLRKICSLISPRSPLLCAESLGKYGPGITRRGLDSFSICSSPRSLASLWLCGGVQLVSEVSPPSVQKLAKVGRGRASFGSTWLRHIVSFVPVIFLLLLLLTSWSGPGLKKPRLIAWRKAQQSRWF